MQERRKHIRQRTYLGGQVAYRQRYCAIDCLVRNLSQDGARLLFFEKATIPTEFDLAIPHKGESRRVRIVWRKQADVGVQFLERAEAVPTIEGMRRINALKDQNAALKRRVAELSEGF